MLPKLCHLDNDLEIIIIIQYEYIHCVVHMTYIPGGYLITWGHFFLTVTYPVWPWPVILKILAQGRAHGWHVRSRSAD